MFVRPSTLPAASPVYPAVVGNRDGPPSRLVTVRVLAATAYHDDHVMKAVPFAEIEDEYDQLVARSAGHLGADPVCTTTHWIVPAAAAFAPRGKPRVWRGTHGIVALLEHENPKGPVLTSFDTVWGFATPFVGPDPEALIGEVIEDLLPQLDFYALSISGVDPASPFFEELQRLAPVGYTDTADRCVGDLSAGFEAWLAQRSSRFRRSLRTALRDTEDAGISVEAVSPTSAPEVNAAIERILAIERRSWKTEAKSGLIGTDLGFFTRSMSQRFARSGGLRIMFATSEDVAVEDVAGEGVAGASSGSADVGYVIGGVVDDRYRGFQHSFDRDYADLSIGKLLQYRNIEWLCSEGITAYDLGMHMDYKESYTDRIESTITLIVADTTR